MKTDRFTDIIRRKLESIRPEFTEKDWARMQASLQQVSPPQTNPPNQPFTVTPGTWAAQPWLLAAAAVSTVVLVTLSVWQRNQINTLRETVQQLNQSAGSRRDSGQLLTPPAEIRQPGLTAQSVRPTEQSASGSIMSSESLSTAEARRDTVYITRYVRVPMQSTGADGNSAPRQFESATERLAASSPTNRTVGDHAMATPNTNANQTNVLNDRSSTLTRSGHRPRPVSTSPTSSVADAGSASDESFRAGSSPAGSGVSPSARPVRSRDQLAGRTSLGTAPAGNDNGTAGNGTVSTPATNGAGSGVSTLGVSDASVSETATDVAATDVTASYERVEGLSLTLGNTDWNRALTLRTRRMRPARTVTVGGQAVAQSKPESQATPFVARFRAGISSDVEAHAWNLGVTGEVLLGRHLTVSAGFSRATYLSGLFLTDIEFNNRTQRDFRREFARGIDPKRDILNIDTRTIRLQIPVSLGYRVPLSPSLAVTPTVGTYLNLSSSENITFYYSDMPRGYSEARYKTDLPNCLLNNVTLGTNVEWQKGHWVGQAGPLVSIPTQPSFGWSKNTTLGARLRVMYQF